VFKLNLNSQLASFVESRNKEIGIRWSKVQIFFLINSALIGFVTSIVKDKILQISGCIAGLVITVIWFAIQLEAQYAIDYWNKKISEVESFGTVKGFNFKHPHEGFRYKYFSTHYLILTLVTVFVMGWLMFLIKLV